MKVHLVDINPDLVSAWEESFRNFPEVTVTCGNILDLAENTIVSPANSYGYMDGGIDAEYLDYFGLTMQERVQQAVALRPEGYLPVGAAVLVETGDTRIPFLISAPTMITPGAVPGSHCFFAMVATLKIASAYRDKVKQVFIPGLATGIGQVSPVVAAEEMAKAYGKWVQGLKSD